MGMLMAIAAGGAIGAVARHLMGAGVGRLLGTEFPWGTLAVNVAGSLVMGLLVEAMALAWSPSQATRAFLTVGILGGFTTFSAFSLDVALLMERGTHAAAAGYVLASVGLSVGGLFVGLRLMRLVAA